ncbi:hypothetical protein DFH08DRAFT_708640, partial [Mycena albidolilacea]
MANVTETSRAGRKASSLATNHFTRLEKLDNKSNRSGWKCNYCGDDPSGKGVSIEGRKNSLPNHLADSRNCPHVPTTARNEALRAMLDKKKTVDSDTTTPNSEVAVVDLTGAEGSASGSALAPRKKRKGEQTTINGFIDQAMSGVQKKIEPIESDYGIFLIHANISFRNSENEFLNDFLSEIRPTYDAPSRFTL